MITKLTKLKEITGMEEDLIAFLLSLNNREKKELQCCLKKRNKRIKYSLSRKIFDN